jgi:predicted NUDIX family NTP pyrophosphohydrolase
MKKSACILVYKQSSQLKVFLVHPGGPFFQKKDLGVWTIPKGEFEEIEEPLLAAKREFEEETGQKIEGNFIELSPIRQKSGKLVLAWAVEGEVNEKEIRSNEFSMEWPYRSGKMQNFPEVDKGEWFDLNSAKLKINPAQIALLDELEKKLKGNGI